MSELHLSLGIIGLLFIAAVFLFNRWQELKFRKQTERMFRGERQDVLFGEPSKKGVDERIEPSFHPEPHGAEEVPSASPRGIVSTSSPAPPPVSHTSFALSVTVDEPVETVKSHGLIDEAIDLIGIMRVNEPVSASSVKSLAARAHTFSKPVHWEGLVSGRWTEMSPGGQYADLRVALQLADRHGPATSAEISRFVSLVQQFAVDLGGSAQTESEDSAAQRATELDGFCAEVDVEIGVNLTAADHTMPGTKLRALAESSGLKLNADGVFHFYDERGTSLFTMRNSESRPFMPEYLKNISTHGVTLLLDVPHVVRGVQVFDRMLQLGRQIASALGGEVVDDNGKPLTDVGADAIRRHLVVVYRKMDGFGIPAGSPLALRLFS